METNLLVETLKILEAYDKKGSDVLWVGSQDGKYAIAWQDFTLIAARTEYNSFAGDGIAHDLVVVGENWWLMRNGHDGATWWVHRCIPIKQKDALPFSTASGQRGLPVQSLNGGDEE
jgi:hypothetical protein